MLKRLFAVMLAVSETLTYLRLANVEAAASLEGEGSYRAALIVAAYERLQQVIETCGSSLSRLLVFLQAAPGVLTVRMLLQAEDLSLAESSEGTDSRGFTQTVSVTKTGPDLLLVFRYEEGGGEL